MEEKKEDEDPEAGLSLEEKRALKKTRFMIAVFFFELVVLAYVDRFICPIQNWIQVLVSLFTI